VHERHGHRAFVNRRGATFHRSMPHIASCEETGYIRFEIIRVSVARPPLRAAAFVQQIWTGHQVSGFVAGDVGFRRPFGVGGGADTENSQRVSIVCVAQVRRFVNVTARKFSSPVRAVTSVSVSSSMLLVVVRRSGNGALRLSPWTTIVTRLANRANCRAA
jgi:hypothetical protein